MRAFGCVARRAPLAAAVLLVALTGLVPAAWAQTATPAWPQRPVKFILPFGAGSATDVAARLMTDRLQARWGKPVVIENRPGGDGLVAIAAFVAANDDHVLLYASSASFIAHPYIHEKLPYDAERDLMPIARLTETILSANVPASSKATTLADFVALARAEPGKLNAAGAAGLPEFTLGYFLKVENLVVTKVPYRDVVQAATDLGSGQIQFLVSSAAAVRPLVQAEKVRTLAVTSRERASFAPAIPTVFEAGFPSLGLETPVGLFGPQTMTPALRERLAADMIAVVSEPEIVARLAATGQIVKTGGPAELAATLRRMASQTATIAQALGLKAK